MLCKGSSIYPLGRYDGQHVPAGHLVLSFCLAQLPVVRGFKHQQVVSALLKMHEQFLVAFMGLKCSEHKWRHHIRAAKMASANLVGMNNAVTLTLSHKVRLPQQPTLPRCRSRTTNYSTWLTRRVIPFSKPALGLPRPRELSCCATLCRRHLATCKWVMAFACVHMCYCIHPRLCTWSTSSMPPCIKSYEGPPQHHRPRPCYNSFKSKSFQLLTTTFLLAPYSTSIASSPPVHGASSIAQSIPSIGAPHCCGASWNG